MARAYASAIIKAPVQAVWSVIRDFNSLPIWHPAIKDSTIEDGLDADVVGCVRAFHLQDGKLVREKLLALDDQNYTFSYNFMPDAPAFPVKNYIATIRLYPVTKDDTCFCEWEAVFDEPAKEQGTYVDIISNAVFAEGWKAMAAYIKKAKVTAPEGRARWKAWSPNKVWTSAVIHGPADKVWKRIRDFAGMGAWHPGISKMHMLGGVRSDKVSGTRDFYFGPGHLHEELIHLNDLERSFSYRITKCELPWLNYVSGPRLWPITATGETFAVWTGDWDASPHDDLWLMPTAENEVYQKAFDTLNAKHFKSKPAAKTPAKSAAKKKAG
jgi:hypothetical protein